MSYHIIIASVLSGILCSMGFGGGTVMIIYLTGFMAFPQTKAQGINLMFFIPLAIYSVIIYARKKLIDIRTVLIISLGGLSGAILGYFLLGQLDSFLLRKLFAAFLILIGVREFLPTKHKSSTP